MISTLSHLPVLLAACVLAAAGTAHADGGDHPANLVVTTHYPPCTAIFMHGRDGVALKTELRPMPVSVSYTDEEIRAGINLTYSATTRLADELVPVLAGRPDVSAVASYSASRPPTLLANATSPGPPSYRCGDLLDSSNLFRTVYDMVWESSKASGASGDSGAAFETVMPWINISTGDSNTEALAFLEEHGITVGPLISEPTATRRGGMTAHDIPVSLLAPLARVDGVLSIEEPAYLELAHGLGSTVSEGVEENPSAGSGTPYFDVNSVLVVSVIAVAGFGGIAAALRARSGKHAARGRS